MRLDRTAVIIALIATVPPTITAAGAVVVALRTAWKVDLVAEKVEVVHKATNSLTAQLVETTRSDAKQEGHTAGVAEQKAAEKSKK